MTMLLIFVEESSYVEIFVKDDTIYAFFIII